MKYQAIVLVLLLSLIFSSVAFGDSSNLHMLERYKNSEKGKVITWINNSKLNLDILTKYLLDIMRTDTTQKNEQNRKVSDLIGVWGFKQNGDEATIYFIYKRTHIYKGRINSKDILNETYHLVRLNSGYWFNTDRNKYVLYRIK